jgi:hypothetical protein
LFCQNYMDAKLVCQTVGVALVVIYPKLGKTDSARV